MSDKLERIWKVTAVT